MFPRLTFCHGHGKGYNESIIKEMGYKNIKDFVIGRKITRHGWLTKDKSTKELFESIYSLPWIENIIRSDSRLKENGSIYSQLKWVEKPMTYEGGRCLQLNFTKAIFSETTIILKFENMNSTNQTIEVDLSITGRLELSTFLFCIFING